MKLFRVESASKDLIIGSDIESSGEYRNYLQDTTNSKVQAMVLIEDCLDETYSTSIIEDCTNETNNTESLIRRDCLFAFHELKDALIFSSNIYKGNAKIYSITINSDSCIHRGDMNLIDLLNIIGTNNIDESANKFLKKLCKGYWDSRHTHSHCYEYILKSATVESIVCDEGECVKFHNEYTCTTSCSFLSVERCSIYQAKIKEVYTDICTDQPSKQIFE